MGREMPIKRRRRSARLAAAAVRAPGQLKQQIGPTIRSSSTSRPYQLRKKHKIDNESSCSSPSPADGTPRSPADDTRTSPSEESPRSHSSPCCSGMSRSSPGGLSDSGKQPHPRNMNEEIDELDNKIITMIGCIASTLPDMSGGWYHLSTELLLKKLKMFRRFDTLTTEMLNERVGKLERMVKDYYENKRSSLPNEERMLYVFSHIAREYEIVPNSQQISGKRTAPVLEELGAPSPKRSRSDSADMAMYLSEPEAASKFSMAMYLSQPETASKFYSSGFSMVDCTLRAQQLFKGEMLYSALALLRENVEIRQSFMTLDESRARGHIVYELKTKGKRGSSKRGGDV